MKILIVSYFYPPYNKVAAKRPFSLARFLSFKGNEIFIIKASDSAYKENVDKKYHELKKVKRYSVETKKYKFKLLNDFINKKKFKGKIESLINNQNNKIDLIIFSGGPFYYFPLGKYFKKKYSIPFILDYRDNIVEGLNKSLKNQLYYFYFSYIYEKKSIPYADLIINVTHYNTKKHKDKYQNEDSKKFITIFNGYDDIELSKFNIEENKEENKSEFNIGIFGKFSYYNKNHVDILIDAISELNKEGLSIKINHIGKIENYFNEKKNNSKYKDILNIMGYKSYKEGMKLLSKMDCLVLNNRSKGALGTKIFDYIYLNKPIICMIDKKSEIANITRNFENSLVTENKEEIKQFIVNIIKKDIKTLGKNIIVNNFSRTYQLDKYYSYIMDIMEN